MSNKEIAKEMGELVLLGRACHKSKKLEEKQSGAEGNAIPRKPPATTADDGAVNKPNNESENAEAGGASVKDTTAGRKTDKQGRKNEGMSTDQWDCAGKCREVFHDKNAMLLEC
jgi:hypothetical protein